MTLGGLINKGVETILEMYPQREAREMVLRYLEDCHGIKRLTHILEPSYELPADAVDSSLAAFRRMASGEPMQYVTGKADFYGRGFVVSPAVLIPRQETEILCKTVCNHIAFGQKALGSDGMTVLDLCTGSGCIAWTLALETPGAEVTAVDISEEALAVASAQNFSAEMAQSGAKAPVFIKGDVLSPETLPVSGKYDIIVSNPPYVMESEKALMRSNVLDHEPSLALFVSDEDPLIFYRAVAQISCDRLSDNGLCMVEINEALGEETAELFRKAGFTNTEIVKDLNDRDRFVVARR